MDIFFTVDDNFRNFFFTTLASILTNSCGNDVFSFHVIDAGLSEATKTEVEKLKKIKDFTIDYTKMNDDEWADYPINETLKSKIYYYRLKIPTLFPDVKRALFLDTDIIVNSSLSKLYNTNMQGKTVAFAANANLEGELQNARLGLSEKHVYFNAGIMLIDCVKWREQGVLEKIQKVTKLKVDALIWADQDILNLVFENNYKRLNQKWNFWPGMDLQYYEGKYKNYLKWYSHTNLSRFEILSALCCPSIVHFAGGAKPNSIVATEMAKELYKKYEKIVQKIGIDVNCAGSEKKMKEICENESSVYSDEFYKLQADMSYNSAKMIIPILEKIYKPKSLLDVGCGIGTWLKAWKESGVESAMGFDGNVVSDEKLFVSRKEIKVVDLEKIEHNVGEKFDLVTSFEVAEHLNEKCADNFVEALTSYADVIFFSAAVPYQGGVNHINEQPPQYWVDKFNKLGYVCFDIVRNDILKLENLPYGCYGQNMFVFTNKPEIFTGQGFKQDQKPTFFYHPWYINAAQEEISRLKIENEKLKITLGANKSNKNIFFSKEKDGNKRTIKVLGLKISYKKENKK